MKSRVLLNSIISLCIFCFLTGCASIVSRSNYNVEISSNVPGAKVVVADKSGKKVHSDITPSTVLLSAKGGYFSPAGYTFNFEKEGYVSSSETRYAKVDPWYFGNFVFGTFGLVGFFIVDPLSGAMWRLNTKVDVILSPDPSNENVRTPHEGSENTQEMAERLKKLDELKALGVISEEEYQKRTQRKYP